MTLTDEAAIGLLTDMVAIASPSGEEDKIALFLRHHLEGLGFAARIDGAGNLIADIGTRRGPTVMLLSHLDTAGRFLPVRLDGSGFLHGRGAVDAKGPLAAMICAAARRADFAGTIRVVGAVEEERLSRGAHHLVRTVAEPDVLIVGEPSGCAGVVLGYKGKLDLEYRVRRPPTHSTNPGEKASEAAVGFWQKLLDTLGPDRDHAAFGKPAATLRRIDADPSAARLEADCRVPPGFDADGFVAGLRAHTGGGELDVVRFIPAVRAARDNLAARSLSAAIRRLGARPRPLLKTGTSDLNTVAPAWTVPMAAYGPGDAGLDHADDERISVGEYLQAIAVLGGALGELAAVMKPC